jgi:hypothetical protein
MTRTLLIAVAVAALSLACQKQSAEAAAARSDAKKVVRPPAEAGRFYPNDAKALADKIAKVLAAAPKVSKDP